MNDTLLLNIENIAKTHADFLVILDSGSDLIVDFEKCSELDLAGLQLLVALIREAKDNKKKVLFRGKLKKEHTQLILLFGLSEVLCLTGEELESNLKAVL